MKWTWSHVWLAMMLNCCTPSPQPVVPIVPDAAPDAGCGTIDKINAARLIRTADGSALYIPCDAGP